jgi:hypothetical protein
LRACKSSKCRAGRLRRRHPTTPRSRQSPHETKLAIENYEKSVTLNPKNEGGKAALAKLREVKTP